MALPHLNSEELNKLRRLVDEGVKVKQEVQDLNESMGDTVKSIAEELDISAKILKKAIQLKFKGNIEDVKEDMSDAEEIIEVVNNKTISGI